MYPPCAHLERNTTKGKLLGDEELVGSFGSLVWRYQP